MKWPHSLHFKSHIISDIKKAAVEYVRGLLLQKCRLCSHNVITHIPGQNYKEIFPALSVGPLGLLLLNSHALCGKQKNDVYILNPGTCDYTGEGDWVANQLTLK